MIGEGELKGSIVDTRHVAGARGLVLLGFDGERVNVDAFGGHVLVVLVRLKEVEVTTLALREAVVAIELELANRHGVLAGTEERADANTGGTTRSTGKGEGECGARHDGGVEGIGEVEPLFAKHSGGVCGRVGNVIVWLHDPH